MDPVDIVVDRLISGLPAVADKDRAVQLTRLLLIRQLLYLSDQSFI